MQTTLDEWAKDPLVDPETRAHVYSLISALGGIGDDGTYTLGDDALLCLKDLRKWLKFADGQLNRRDVARCMAEANLVKGDLLEILAKISGRVMQDRMKHKVAVASLELLVPLTWPFEIDPVEATVNHLRHGPYIQLAQIGYKRAILQFDRARILQTAVRVALPSMAISLRERPPRDEGIIRIALYFIRNIAMLSPPQSVPIDMDEAEISRSTTVDTFQDQDIFQVILSVASSIGEDFVSQDVIILEILFFLLKGIDAEKLFMEEKRLNTKNTKELKSLIQKEKAMLAGYARHAPSRHNKFGTMVWVKRDEDKVSTLSGQDVLGKAQRSMQKMDTSKKWNKPKRATKKTDEEQAREEFDLPIALTASARKHLKAFVEEFLDSSFNPLFLHLRKAIERETERVEPRHGKQFFYLVSWFLKAECARRRNIKERAADPKSVEILTAEDESYGLVAEVMNQETFILLNRHMQRSQDEKAWPDLNAGMKCFTQILLTVQEMSDSGLEDDQEIAENIQNRIFYEESTHDRVVGILRSYKDQGFGYLDACTELSHVFLRMLERYAKQNVDLQVRSRRRARKIKKKQAQAEGNENRNNNEEQVSEIEDMNAAQRVSTERRFDFARFAAKFINQSAVNTFVSFAKYYQDMDAEQLKRAHRFFHRVAFKMELGVLLYRVEVLQLFMKMIKGPEGLDPDASGFKEWDDLVRHFFRTVVKRVEARPELVVELLFSKIPATTFFLEHGYEKEVTVRAPRAPAELEVKPGMEKPDQVGVAVGVLVNQQKTDALHWVRDTLVKAAEERKAWEDMEEARKQAAPTPAEGETAPEDSSEQRKAPSILVKSDNEERRVAMFKDNKLRLLMKLVGFDRLGADNDPDATWIVPSSISAAELQESIDLLRKFEFDPPTYEDGKGPEDLLRSKTAASRRSARRAEFDDDSDGIDNDSEEDRGEYALDRPTTHEGEPKKKMLSRRRRERSTREIDDEEKDGRAEARRQKEIEKQRKVKSTMFVHDSDDDWEYNEDKDREFFEKENAIREQTKQSFLKLLTLGSTDLASSKKRKADAPPKAINKRRKSPKGTEASGTDDAMSDVDIERPKTVSKKRKATPKRRTGPFDSDSEDADGDVMSSRASSEVVPAVLDEESADDVSDTPLSSQHAAVALESDDGIPRTAKQTAMAGDGDVDMADADDDEDDGPVARKPAPDRRVRAGFIVDSDSE